MREMRRRSTTTKPNDDIAVIDENYNEIKPMRVTALATTSTTATTYAAALQQLSTDSAVQKEVNLGKRIALYKLGRELGSGNFAKVKIGVHILLKEKVAVKIVDKAKMDQKAMKLMAREIENMDNMLHPNIVQLFEVVETFSKLYLVCEYASGGELYTYVMEKGRLGEQETAHIFAQVVNAIDYMHGKCIIHRDIKAENVYFASPGHVKVGDMGFSCQITPGVAVHTFCGSPPYAAPELFKDVQYQGVLVDIWSLGILLYFMLVGNTPFRGDTVAQLKILILDAAFEIPELVAEKCQMLIKTILVLAPEERPSVKQILADPWLSSFTALPPPKLRNLPSIDVEDKEEVSQIEREACTRCDTLGVDSRTLNSAIVNGCKSSAIGVFRIAQYVIAEQSATSRAIKETNVREKETAIGNVKHRPPPLLKKESKLCTIL